MSGCESGWAGYSYCYTAQSQVHNAYNQPTQYCNPHLLQSAFHHTHFSPYTDFPDGTPSCPPHYWDGDELIDAFGRVVKRRSSANKKERRRTQSINNAFSELRDCIPNVPADTKLSKIKTLRLATSYIAYLMQVLHTDPEVAVHTEFKAELPPKPRRTSSDIEREDSDMETDSSTNSPSISETIQTISILATSTQGPLSTVTTAPSVCPTTPTVTPKQAWPPTVWTNPLQY